MKKRIIIFFILSVNSLFFVNAQCDLKTYLKTDGLLSDTVNVVAVNGEYIAAGTGFTYLQGITWYDGSNWHTYVDDSIMQSVSVIEVDKKGRIYYSSYGTGLHIYDGVTRTILHQSDGLPKGDIQALAISPHGKLWVGTSEGIGVFDGSNWIYFSKSNGLCDNYVTNITFDKAGRPVVSSINGCFSVYNGVSWSSTTIPSDEGGSVAIDQDGNYWFNTYNFTSGQSEIVKYDGSNFTKYSYYGFTGNPYVSRIVSDHVGNIWVATSKGIARFNGASWKIFTTINGLPYDLINDIVPVMQKNSWSVNYPVWIATDKGLTRFTQLTRIKGLILDNSGTKVNAGYVLLFSKNSGVKSLIKYDSSKISANGEFDFQDIPVGAYLLVAIPDPTVYPDLLKTYFADKAEWFNAGLVVLKTCDTSAVNLKINLKKRLILAKGKGHISGYIKSLDGTRAGTNPVKDVDVTLKKVPGGTVNKVTTNNSGYYRFDELPVGFYQLTVDLPGLLPDSTRSIRITTNDTAFTNQDFGVDSNGIHNDDFSSINSRRALLQLSIFPNPVSDYLKISGIDDESELTILSLHGKEVVHSKIRNLNGKFKIPVEFLNPGYYLLHISNKHGYFTSSFIKM